METVQKVGKVTYMAVAMTSFIIYCDATVVNM
jgi:hypothetical protein